MRERTDFMANNMIIQLLYIFLIRGNDENNQIVFIAMSFSILSITICIFSIISQREIQRSTAYISIEFDVTGLKSVKACRNRVDALKERIATYLGEPPSLFDIPRPKRMPDGLK